MSAPTLAPARRVGGVRREHKRHSKSQVMSGLLVAPAAISLYTEALGAFLAHVGNACTTRMYGSKRPDVIEVFGGHSEISMVASRQGWFAMQPFDQKYGTDLRDPDQGPESRLGYFHRTSNTTVG